MEMNPNNQGESTGYLLYHLTMLMQRKMKRKLDKLYITHTQFVILAAAFMLSEKNQSVNQIEIANQSNIDKMMVSKVLRTLQSKGLITRQEHLTDTRAKIIQLTDDGNALFKKAFVVVKNVEKEFFGHLENEVESFNEKIKILLTQNQ